MELVIRDKFAYRSEFPGGGHWRRDLTSADVRFFSVYSYLIVYRETKPLQIVAILHGSPDVAKILNEESLTANLELVNSNEGNRTARLYPFESRNRSI